MPSASVLPYPHSLNTPVANRYLEPLVSSYFGYVVGKKAYEPI